MHQKFMLSMENIKDKLKINCLKNVTEKSPLTSR